MGDPDAIAALPYPIHFGGAESRLRGLLSAASFSSVFILCDSNTARFCLPLLGDIPELAAAQRIEIPAGEASKQLEICKYVWQQLSAGGADRASLLLNIGGGVVGDLGGFCASTFMRGIAFVQVPTSLLAMVDASAGSKTGIDLGPAKNLVGTFADPLAVLIDPLFLRTLPEQEYVAGWAEMLKHGLIADAGHFREMASWEDPRSAPDIGRAIRHSIGIKAAIVARDPREAGLRKILNAGHTIGHAIESYFLDRGQALCHGYAVAAGLRCECYLSKEMGLLPAADWQEIEDLLARHYPALPIGPSAIGQLLAYMQADKKKRGGRMLFALPDALGSCRYDLQADEAAVSRALSWYCAPVR